MRLLSLFSRKDGSTVIAAVSASIVFMLVSANANARGVGVTHPQTKLDTQVSKATPKIATTKKPVKSASQPGLKSTDTIRSYDELMRLSEKERAMYVVGVEGLLNALAESDRELQTEYQTADRRWEILETIFGASAFAADNSDRRCIYAGSVSEMDINGRYCMRPLNQGCPGKITCNPLIYGAKQCVPGGSQAKYASRNCAEKAKSIPLSKIVKAIEGKRDEWEAFRKELAGYCESPRPSQKGLCLTVRARVKRIEATLPSQAAKGPKTEELAPPQAVPEAQPAPEAPAPAGTAASPQSTETSPGVSIAPAADDAPLAVRPRRGKGTIALAPSEGATVAAVTGAGQVCSPSFLLGDLKNENDAYTYGLNLMSIGEAQDLMCTNGGINSKWVDEVRKMLRYKLSQVNTVPARYRNNERAEIEKTSSNFEACLKQAQESRQGKTFSDPYPNGGSISIGGYAPGVPSYKQDPKSISANFTDNSGVNLGMVDVGHMGAWIEQKQISICKVKIVVRDVSNPEERNVGRPATFPGARSGSSN